MHFMMNYLGLSFLYGFLWAKESDYVWLSSIFVSIFTNAEVNTDKTVCIRTKF